MPFKLPTAARNGGRHLRLLVRGGREETPNHDQFMRWLALDLLRKAVWQRWTYVSYFSVCEPGQEDATFARMEK